MESEFSSSSSKRDRDSGSKDGPLGEQPDDELTIPRAAMNKMIKELLPNIRVANGARELVLNCCTEFIHLVSSESNDICNQQQKKMLSAEHVLVALEKLGFEDFRKDAEEVLTECKETKTAAKRKKKSTRLENLGIPEEELLRQQQELFNKARETALLQERQQGEGKNSGGGGDGNVGEGQDQDSGSEEETEY